MPRMKPIIEGPMNSSESGLATLLAAAGDPMRLRILSLLRTRSYSVGEICESLQAAQPRVSHHLAILRRSRLLEVEVKGRQRFYHWPTDDSRTAEGELRVFLRKWMAGSEVHEEERPVPKAPTVHDEGLEDFLL